MIVALRKPSSKRHAAFCAILLTTSGGASAQSAVEQFYRGRTIDLTIGFTPGGGYDLVGRLVAKYMGDYIPGKPRIVPRTMAGGGSRIAASYIYSAATKDGTQIGIADQAMPVQQVVGDPTIQFDTQKFAFIGNPIVDNNVVVTWATSGVKTIADAKTREIAIGATGYNTSSQYPQALNTVAGTKFKIILGYPGANEINIAMERGEVGGRGSNSWDSYKATKPDWVRDHKINVLVQIGLEKALDLPDIPLLMDLASNETDRAALKVLSAPPKIGRPFFTTPGVPPDRLGALRAAFDAVMKNPDFLSEAKALGLDIDAIPGQDLQTIVADVVATPKPVADRLSRIIALPEQGNVKAH